MVDRRGFLTASTAVSLGAFAGCSSPPPELPRRGPLPEHGIDHVVVVMMENRSFDHFLGWLPGANAQREQLSFVDDRGDTHHPFHLERFDSCGLEDPDHSRAGGRRQLNGGACDGFLREAADLLPISYYNGEDQPFWGTAAPAWTVCDQYHAGFLGPTLPNRIMQHCGRTDRWRNDITISTLPTIWDRLDAAGLTGRYYFSDAPVVALTGLRHLAISRTVDQFVTDCRAGTLPHVSFVDPSLLQSPWGNSTDYHPHSDIRLGDRFLWTVYEAVTKSPQWERTLMIVNFDEWGGFFDHVAPPGDRGFRVPCLMVSPYARRGHIAHDLYDHRSVLKLIQWGFDLRSLTPEVDAAANLADALDFDSAPDVTAPHWSMPQFTADVERCTREFTDSLWERVVDAARGAGFPV